MDTPIQVDLGRIAQDLQIRRVQVESVVQLLDEGNTVPFITRYRKERTGSLNELAIREIQLRVGRLRELAERKETVLKSIEAQGKLTDELRDAIRAADNPKRLEDLYLPYKPKKRTKASDAREKGLEPLALRIWNRDETLTDLAAAATEYLNPEKELDTPEKVIEGVGYILAESINELANVRDAVRRVVWKLGKIATVKADNVAESVGLEYRDYFNYSEPVGHIPPHRVLAINRGDKENVLKVKLEVPRQDLERALFTQLPLEGHPTGEFFHKSAIDALDRLLVPSLEREVRRDLTDMAERHAVDVFARNLRSLLLQPPITKQVVMAIDPGFRTGCKVAVLDPNGVVLDHGTIHPHQPQNRRYEAKLALKDWVLKHQVGVVAIGNGTACRETEELVAEVISEGTYFHEHPGETAYPGAAPAAPTSGSTSGPEASGAGAPAAEPTPAPSEEGETAPEEAEGNAEAGTLPDAIASATPTSEVTTTPVDAETHNGEQAATPAEGDAAPAAEQPSIETMPPITGGAPDGEEHAETPPAAETPVEPVAHAAPEPPAPETAPTPETPASETPGETTAEAAPAESTAGAPDASPAPAAAQAATETSAEAPKPEEAAAPAAEAAAPADGDAAKPADAEAPAPPKMVSLTSPPPAPPKSKQSQPKPPKTKQPPPPPKPHAADGLLAQLAYVIVNEAGASVYSVSPVGNEEFPDLDAAARGTISIGRRLQDPLAELVKIEPQNIGVGLYQHDVNPKQLKESLESVIESCVNFVGVDLNTASVPLLRHVSGLNQLTARRIADFRKEKGPFTGRDQLKEVEGVGPATFTQAAGFLKIPGGGHPLDRTWIHPESYEVAGKLLEKLGFAPEAILDKEQLQALRTKLNEVDLPALARELSVGEPTLHDIFESLARPERDPREDLPKPIFKKGVLKLEDLSVGMELKGTVLNVVDFGAFVDIGLKDSGLVHISQLANRYIKSPHDVVSVGDVVTVWVMGVDSERARVSLTMVKPGTERPRGGGGGGGGRRGQGEGRPGGERRGAGASRGPRREGGAPQPAGAAGEAGQGQQSRAGGGGRSGEGRPAGPGSRIPGPPSRQGQGAGRGGPRSGAHARAERPATPTPRPAPKPSKPAPPPPPLSKDALAGSVPLRTFGQLKQLWQARTEESTPESPAAPADSENQTQNPPAATEAQAPQEPKAAEPQEPTSQPVSDSSTS